MRWFDPPRTEVERAWIAHRAREIAAETGCEEGIARAEAAAEIEQLIASGKPMPWVGRVTPIHRRHRA